jgi:hypothetical protein
VAVAALACIAHAKPSCAEDFHLEENSLVCPTVDQLKEYVKAMKANDGMWGISVGCIPLYVEHKVGVLDDLGEGMVKVRVFAPFTFESSVAYTIKLWIHRGLPSLVNPADLPYDSWSKMGTGKLRICLDEIITDGDLPATFKVPAGTVFRDRGTVDNDKAPWWNLSIVTTETVGIKHGTRCVQAAGRVVVDPEPMAPQARFPAVHAFKKIQNRQLVPWDRLVTAPWDYASSRSIGAPPDTPDLVGIPVSDFE